MKFNELYTKLLTESINESQSVERIDSKYIYFPDDKEVYQIEPRYQRVGTEKDLNKFFPDGYRKVMVATGEDIIDFVWTRDRSVSLDIDDSGSWFIVRGSAIKNLPKENVFDAYIEHDKMIRNLDPETKEDWKDILPNI